MFSKLRYLNQSASARGSLCRAKTCLDKTAIVIRDTHHVTGSCFFCQDYQKKNDVLCEPNGAYLSCQHVNKTSSGHLGARLPWEITKCHVKREISAVKHSQLRRSNLHQRTQGTIAGLERGLLRLRKSEHVNNIVQSHFFSTTSARSFVAPSAVLQKTDTDKGTSWISKIKTAISGKEEADKSFHTEDPVKIIYDKEKPLVIVHGKETLVIETDAVVAEDESFWPLLRGCDTIEEVLTLMGPKIERKELDIDQYLEVLHKLQMIIYTSLQQQYESWEGDEMVPGIFVKLLLNDSRLAEFEFLGKSSSFQRLQDNLVQLIPEMTAAQFTSCLSGFIWLGVDSTSSTIVTFISHLDDFPYKEFTVSTLHILSVCLMSLPRPDVLIVKYIYPRLKALIEDGNEIDPDRKNLFSLIFLGHVNIPDIDIGIWLSEQILKIAETTDNLKDPFLAGWCLKFCSNMIKLMKESDYGHNLINPFESHSQLEQLSELASAKEKLTDLVIINLMDVCDSLMGNDVARVAGSAFKMGIYGLPWADMMKQRSLDIFFDDTLCIAQRLSALVGLIGCVDMDIEMRMKIESVILTMIEDADVWSTSHVLDYLGHLQVNSPDLVAVCEKKIVQTFDKMMDYRILSKKLYLFLANCAMQDEDKHVCLQTKLIDTEQISFNQDLILDYIITQKSWLDTSTQVLERVTEHASRCSFRHYIRLVNIAADGRKWNSLVSRLRSQGKFNGQTAKAVRAFEMCCAIRYFRAAEANDELDNLLFLSSKIVMIKPTLLCQNTLIRSVEKAPESILYKRKNFKRLLNIFFKLDIPPGCISGRVFHRLLDAFDQLDPVNEAYADKILSITRNWFCVELEEVTAPLKDKIQDVFGRKLDLLTENRGLVTTVFNIESLCILGIFPEAALVDLLNVDTMAKLDEIIDDTGSEGSGFGSIKEALAAINRCVVVDKGDMKIPWFMGTFVEDRNKLLSTVDNFRAAQEWQYNRMCGILGEGNFAANREVEYGYKVGFACLMDKDNNLLPFKEKNFTFAKELGLQRVVIEFTTHAQSRRNQSSSALRKTHLQKLGYRFVELNEWELFSMAWSSADECDAYFRKKILGELSEKLTPPWYAGREEELVAAHGQAANKKTAL